MTVQVHVRVGVHMGVHIHTRTRAHTGTRARAHIHTRARGRTHGRTYRYTCASAHTLIPTIAYSVNVVAVRVQVNVRVGTYIPSHTLCVALAVLSLMSTRHPLVHPHLGLK